jgi:hypothetical protein
MDMNPITQIRHKIGEQRRPFTVKIISAAKGRLRLAET